MLHLKPSLYDREGERHYGRADSTATALILATVLHKHSLKKNNFFPNKLLISGKKMSVSKDKGVGRCQDAVLCAWPGGWAEAAIASSLLAVRGFVVSVTARRALSSEKFKVDLPGCLLYNELLQKELLNSKLKFYLKRNWNKLLLKAWEPQKQLSVSEQK